MFDKTTTITRALLPAITTTRAARIAAAHARHPIPATAAIVPLFDHYDPQRDAREEKRQAREARRLAREAKKQQQAAADSDALEDE